MLGLDNKGGLEEESSQTGKSIVPPLNSTEGKLQWTASQIEEWYCGSEHSEDSDEADQEKDNGGREAMVKSYN